MTAMLGPKRLYGGVEFDAANDSGAEAFLLLVVLLVITVASLWLKSSFGGFVSIWGGR